jgi:hypothetical protein
MLIDDVGGLLIIKLILGMEFKLEIRNVGKTWNLS